MDREQFIRVHGFPPESFFKEPMTWENTKKMFAHDTPKPNFKALGIYWLVVGALICVWVAYEAGVFDWLASLF